jgi:NAD(P)-dependent dehydrogenase (short-subunit alcohol dehydrogenase family)
MEIDGLTAVISGGASGLGEACARLLVAAGAHVSLLDIAEEAGERLAGELGESALFCQTDVGDEAVVQAAVDQTVERFGAIHVAISCAGVLSASKVLGKKGPIPMDGFNHVVRVNLLGNVHVIRSAGEQMLKNPPNADGEKGVVINTASSAAFEGQIGQAAYSASKAAVVGMTLPIAREFGDYGIRVVSIAPGVFDTAMARSLPDPLREALLQDIPFPKRMAKPSEFAMLARHIIENPILNGETIRLDGAARMQAK